MTNASEHWFEFAKNDLRDAKILFKNKSYQGAIWHCHQALEKHLKGTLSQRLLKIRKTHDIPTLLKDTGLKFPKSILNFAEELNGYYQPARYPDTALDSPLSYKRISADKLLKLTKETIKWLNFHNHKPKK